MDLLSDEAFVLSFKKDGCLVSDASFVMSFLPQHFWFFYHENMIRCPYNKESIASRLCECVRATGTAAVLRFTVEND